MAMTKEKSEIVKFKSCFSFIGQTAPKSRITNAELTVAHKLNQGTLRHRAVFDGGALFGYFLGKQKVTRNKSKSWFSFIRKSAPKSRLIPKSL